MIQGDDRDIFSLRRAGVLLHPTCLPAEWGVLGESARNFVDFLAASRLGIWQTLPLGPTHPDLSPYQSLSAHAGNPDLIDLTELTKSGLLNEETLARADKASRRQLFGIAAQRFFSHKRSGGDGLDKGAYLDFQNTNQYWLDDFCLFCAIREVLAASGWLDWPDALKNRKADALRA
ncbi:MAG TPA: 4-alpha-glucanotransferase, partial [Marinobacter sp.]|nr:4-alpha-glucanotransferase [Marinobacter sp.]